MNTIFIKKLELFNFKGVRNLIIEFQDKITNISGKNETGKTTIFDAFTWVLFGKNSDDKSQFNIKTLDKNNVAIPKIEHSVAVWLDVNGTEVVLKRLYKEKWVKKRGALEAEFTGNETLYYWNDVPLLANEYQQKIGELVDEGIFRLITSPLYFNSLPWKDRRNVLIDVCGDVSDQDVIGDNENFLKFITSLGEKTIELYQREIASKKKLLNNDLKLIPTRIDEATRGMPGPLDFKELMFDVVSLESNLAKVEDKILNKSKALEGAQNEHLKTQNKVFDLKKTIQNIEFSEQKILDAKELNKRSKLTDLKFVFDTKTQRYLYLKSLTKGLKEGRDGITKKMNVLRDDWTTLNAKQWKFDPISGVCNECKRPLPKETVDGKKIQYQDNFNKAKSERLAAINKSGLELKEEVENLNRNIDVNLKEYNSLHLELVKLKTEIDLETELVENYKKPQLEEYLKDHVEYQKLVKELNVLEANTSEVPTVDYQELNEDKLKINDLIDEKKQLLATENTIALAKKRIKELGDKEKSLAQQISELEKDEFIIDEFTRAKVDMLEEKINGKFKYAKFKLFEIQINEGLKPCCETLYNGVPFSDLNSAACINVGLDIINTLSDYHSVNAPIFVDHSESVNELIPVKSQLIRLVVTKDKELKIA